MLDLLDAAQRISRFAKRDAVSDDFRRAVEIAVKDGYFESWPFRGLIAAFGILIIAFFGGTIYSTIQIASIQQRNEDAQQKITEQVNTFEHQAKVASNDIEDKASYIDGLIRNAVTSKEGDFGKSVAKAQADLSGYIADTKSTLDKQQTEIVTGMKHEVQESIQGAVSDLQKEMQIQSATALKAIDAARDTAIGNLQIQSDQRIKSWNAMDATVTGSRDTALKAIDAARDTAIGNLQIQSDQRIKSWNVMDTTVTGSRDTALSAINAARDTVVGNLKGQPSQVDDQKNLAISSIQLTETKAKTDIRKLEALVEDAQDTTTRAMRKAQDTTADAANTAQSEIAKASTAAKQQLHTEVNQIPEQIATLASSVASVDRALDNYPAGIGGIINKLSKANNMNSIDLVTVVLARSYILVLGALALGVFALVLAGWGLRRTSKLKSQISQLSSPPRTLP